MPWNLTRYYGNGDLHFITCSCYRRQPLLGSAPRRNLFLKVLEEVQQRHQFVVVGYVVMPEHFHLLISEPQESTPSKVMQALKLSFARRVLHQMRGRGSAAQSALFDHAPQHIWQKRFYDSMPHQKEAGREAALHASQPGQARTSRIPGTLALEQLSLLRFRRAWSGEGERVASPEDENPPACCVRQNPPLQAARLPTSRKEREKWGTPIYYGS
jgi:REP element-mobilizing transposase RayT